VIEDFTKIYENNIWGNDQEKMYSGSSGGGSNIEFNIPYINFLKKFIVYKNIKTIVDIGCGSFKFGTLIYNDLNIKYTGYDVYEKIISNHQKKYSEDKYNFINMDAFSQKENIVNSDLCILKDVIQHWSISCIDAFIGYLIENKKFKYILICNCGNQDVDNTDILIGDFRPLSCKFNPLKKYNAIKVFEYNMKEVSIIETDESQSLKNLTYFHGDIARHNHFYIYPKDKPILNKQWDFYENPCDNCKFIKEEDITTYQCLGHAF
jgi:hypothetical protein